MKTNTSTKMRVASFILFSLFFSSVNVFGQVQQNGELYIGDNGIVSVFTTPFVLGDAPATTTTSRTPGVFGRLHFSAGKTWGGNFPSHVNGYMSTLGNSTFFFQIGDGTKRAPIRIQNADAVNAVAAAYYNANPTTIGSNVDANTLKVISTVEYWDVQSVATSTYLTLSWRSTSGLAAISPGVTLDDIVIAGWNGTEWVQIPSTYELTYFSNGVNSSVLSNVGSVKSDFPVDYTLYSKFTLGVRGSCRPTVASSGVTKTWNGSWSPSAPTLADPVVINAAYNAGSFECNSLTLNADVTLDADQYVEIVNGASGTGKIIMDSSASVIQRASGVNGPNVEMTKTSNALRRYDYVYYGTPIVGNFLSDFATAKASTSGTANAFDLFYKYNTGVGGGWQPASTTVSGEGLIARVKNAAPFVNATASDDVSVVFDGVANNGDITLNNISNNPAQHNGATSHILLGNPYPSAIDGIKFLEENTGLDGVLYIWNSGQNYNTSTGAYSQADYLSYTKAGFTLPAPITATFDGNIPSGQGFNVKILPDALNPTTVTATTNVVFNNCMRVNGNNSTFYRSSQASVTNEDTIDRFKLNMTGSNDVFSQILVAYMPETTLGYDRMYDAGRNSVSTAQLYSILEEDGRRLAINARPNFENTDVVPVGIRKNNTNLETFVISISDKEGVFTNPNVTVYLHDKIANTYHDLNSGDFTFTTAETQLNARYEIVYQNSVLSNEDFVAPEAIVVLNDNTLSVSSPNTISNIIVYDVTGRVVQKFESIDENTFSGSFNHAKSVYIARIYFEDGSIVSKKLIHAKN